MTRLHLEHIVRAAGSIVGAETIVVIGSQAILGSFPDAPAELRVSMEAPVYPLEEPRKADIIDGAIGEESPFHNEFGYYAHGVGPETATLPPGWMQRAVRIHNNNTRGVTAICPAPQDLAVAKLAAGRSKDIEFVRALARHGLVTVDAIQVAARELPPGARDLVLDSLKLIR